ncbi:MAG: methyltransferase [bacterium]|nr:methyltransferase [bacterium]
MSSYVSVTVEGGSQDARERALALGVAAGALGAEERNGPPPSLIMFVGAEDGEAVEAALRDALGEELHIGVPVPIAEVAWSEAWKEGLEPIVVSPRLAVTPSFVPFEPSPGQIALVIDPGQAFGTGGHASTRLALDLLDALPQAAIAEQRVLDVGCGTGVLALAALGLGAKQAVALDLDPLATEATWENAARNRLTAGLSVWTGPIEGLGERPFDLVLANMIRAELFPLLEAIRARCSAGGRVILSGLLDEEQALVDEALAGVGLEAVESRRHQDALGDHWLAISCITISG